MIIHSSLDSHDVGSLSVTAWSADDDDPLTADAFVSSQVLLASCLTPSVNSRDGSGSGVGGVNNRVTIYKVS